MNNTLLPPTRPNGKPVLTATQQRRYLLLSLGMTHQQIAEREGTTREKITACLIRASRRWPEIPKRPGRPAAKHEKRKPTPTLPNGCRLTQKQLAVAALRARGLTHQQIAQELGMKRQRVGEVLNRAEARYPDLRTFTRQSAAALKRTYANLAEIEYSS